MEILDSSSYVERMLAAPRPGSGELLAFYEHRVGAITTDPRLVLAPLDDHLCHRGDGVFETIVYRQRRVFQLDAHLERMRNSAAGLKITPPCPWEEIRSILLEVAKAGGQDDGSLRALIGRGPGGFGISPAECPTASLYVAGLRCPVPPAGFYEKEFTAFRSSIPAKQEYLARIKNVNYLPNVLMTEEARERGMNLAISFDAQDCLAEAAIANVGIVDKDGVLVCPEFTHSLPGTTVLAAMDAVKDVMPTAFRAVKAAELATVREMLLFSSAPLCIGITHFEGNPIGDGKPGPVSRLVRERLAQRLQAEGVPF